MAVGEIIAFVDRATVIVEGVRIALDVYKKSKERFKDSEERTAPQKYYEKIVSDFREKESSELVSQESLALDHVYLDAYSEEHPKKKILDEIESWCEEQRFGVMLVCGEPGHGKTTLCRKAVHEHFMKGAYQNKRNVFWFRLNPAYSEIIQGGKLVLKNCFGWGIRDLRQPIDRKDCEGGLIFLDGYDELKMQAQGIGLQFSDFVQTVWDYAEELQMHVVITARTRSLAWENHGRLDRELTLAPLTEEQQDEWIQRRFELHAYREDFQTLRQNEEMQKLLGIPVLFRMIVEARLEDTASGVVDLYDKLFDHTMGRRRLRDQETQEWKEKYERLAYEIYRNDETSTTVDQETFGEEILYLFYLRGGGQYAEFLHRSFYQYFLARFLYRELTEVGDVDNAKPFLCFLAERKLDDDVLDDIRQMQQKDKGSVQAACEHVLDAVAQTDAVIIEALEAAAEGTGARHRLDRCNNMFVNALSLCHIVAQAGGFSVSLSDRVRELLRSYSCEGIHMPDAILEEADLTGANLFGANLSGANFKGARLIGANLIGANLSGAQLIGAQLSGARLIGADLIGANLNGANLIGANLIGADLIGADLSRADFSGADFSGADFSGADLRCAQDLETCRFDSDTQWDDCKILLCDRENLQLENPDAHGIVWCDDDGKPISE
ncbi:MAG TPA: pentapeptide repeat-containing protein [Candidatus Butyricicoccus stercorigallinarum]|nr:pentapeptide repeat-containing protein [Candidatus Butyricicoccus stercorigallinarum]